MRGGWNQTLKVMNHHTGVVRRGASFPKLVLIGLNILARIPASHDKHVQMSSSVKKPTPHYQYVPQVCNDSSLNVSKMRLNAAFSPSFNVFLIRHLQDGGLRRFKRGAFLQVAKFLESADMSSQKPKTNN